MAAFNLATFATSVFVVAVAVGTLTYGLEYTRYQIAAFDRPYPPREVALAFAGFAGLRGPARRALAPEDALATASRHEIETVLAAEPANGVYWLALAENLQRAGGAGAAMLEALHMSEAVQPREAATMARRAVFILAHWEDLPDSDRRLAAAHLAELGEELPSEPRAAIVAIVAAEPEPVRKQIEAALVEAARGDRRLLPGLGL